VIAFRNKRIFLSPYHVRPKLDIFSDKLTGSQFFTVKKSLLMYLIIWSRKNVWRSSTRRVNHRTRSIACDRSENVHCGQDERFRLGTGGWRSGYNFFPCYASGKFSARLCIVDEGACALTSLEVLKGRLQTRPIQGWSSAFVTKLEVPRRMFPLIELSTVKFDMTEWNILRKI